MQIKLVKSGDGDEYEVRMVGDGPKDPVSKGEKILYMVVIALGLLFGLFYFAAMGLARVMGF